MAGLESPSIPYYLLPSLLSAGPATAPEPCDGCEDE